VQLFAFWFLLLLVLFSFAEAFVQIVAIGVRFFEAD